jgi:Bacterial protein of unknown function (DUF922)
MSLVKKSFLFVLISFLCSNAFAQTTVSVTWTEKPKLNAKDVIYYNANKKLIWANFLGTAPPPSSVAAVTSSGFGYNASMKSTNGVGTISIAVYCYFSKPKSWVRVKNKTAYILEHEQHHFDASYLAAVSFMQKVKAANITTENMNEVIGKIYKEVSAAMNKMQDDYDNETNNGLKKDKQAEWNIFFNEKMKTFL